ncbi:hypothetical protein ZWY2020_022694 [Hordeum vulgare]|nr:hypothetical protein ZWY2020_022694 [Hordeum vulgare]
MESLLLSRFTPTRTSSPLYSRPPLRLRSPLQLPARLRHRHLRLCSSPGGSRGTDATEDEASNSKNPEDDLGTLVRKVFDAYRNSNNDLRTFLQNLVDAGLTDESEAFGGEDDELLRSLLDADLPGRSPDLGVLWKLPAVAAFSFAGVPALLGCLGDAAGVDRVPAWMPLVYSLASFVVGSLLVADASVSDEEWDEWVGRRERGGDLSFLESEEVLWRTARRVPAAALAATAAGEAALRAAAAATGLDDLQPPVWVAFLLFGLLLGVPYGVFSASFDPAVRGSWLGWDEFVTNIRDVVLRAGDVDVDGRGRK